MSSPKIQRFMFSSADLIVKNNAIYHLNMSAEMLADTIICVGDPERVAKVTKHFSKITHKAAKREFVSASGVYKEKRLLVLSTGIGTSNIDIVMNEINALSKIDLISKKPINSNKALNFIRIGTSGSIQPEIKAGSIIVSHSALGIDNLMHFYKAEANEKEQKIAQSVIQVFDNSIQPYCFEAQGPLLQKAKAKYPGGITLTTPGFYAPQQRDLFQKNKFINFIDQLSAINMPDNERITNIEMETSALYGLSKVFGHNCLSFNLILAERKENTFIQNPDLAEEDFIKEILDWAVENV